MTEDELVSFLARFDPNIRSIARQIRDLLLVHVPGAVETIDKENLGIGIAPGYKGLIFVITPQKMHVTLGIYDGAILPDPQGLLQGRGKRHRHLKIMSQTDLEVPGIQGLIEEAVKMKNEKNRNTGGKI
jgi:hypothetical protein